MSPIDYDERAAAAFEACRQLPPSGTTQWRAAIARYLEPRTGMRVLDVGAGTGAWATMLAEWFDITVVAVEPSAAMRARSACPAMIGGDTQAPARRRGRGRRVAVHRRPPSAGPARRG
jgi:SAM-dependent methyltransferase